MSNYKDRIRNEIKENAKQMSWYLKGRSSCGKSENNQIRRSYTDRVKYMLTTCRVKETARQGKRIPSWTVNDGNYLV